MMANAEQEERTAVEELKKRMRDVPEEELYGDDSLFYRFLKARDFNVDDAEKMLREHLKWRKKYDVKNVSKYKHPEVLEKYISFNRLGHDKEGSVVHYLATGTIDWIGLISSCKQDDLAKMVISVFEQDFIDLERYKEKTGKNAEKIVYILNMEGFSFAQATNKRVVSSFIFLINLYQDNYPETLKAMNVINASTYFYLVFSLMKRFLPVTVLNKFNIYTDDSWKKDFPKLIDADVLPAFLGGERKDLDGNPLCLSFMYHGGTVPHQYYILKSKRSLANAPDFQRISLSRKSRHEIPLDVKEPDCYLEWEFETKTRDIGFGIFHEDAKGNRTQMIPVQRIHTNDYSETGVYKCDKTGKYIAIFDNSYSVIRKKDIFFKIKVVKQQEENCDTLT